MKSLFDLLREVIRFKIYLPIRGAAAAFWDRYYGIETESTATLASLGVDPGVGVDYEATPHLDFLRILRSLDIHPGDVFLDFGSGKGRTLILAGRFPFKRIVGVDVSERLNELCRRNIERAMPGLSCRAFDIATCEATAYPIPDDVTFVYFFNPFPLAVMDKVIRNIEESLKRAPRDLTILYYNPRQAEELEARHSLRRVREMEFFHFFLFRSRCYVYRLERRPELKHG